MNLSARGMPRSNRFQLLILIAVASLTAALLLALTALPGAAETAAAQGPDAPQGAANVFQANLSGAEEVPAVDTRASGRAVLALSEDMTTLYYRVKVHDIVSITMAHIHLGARGTNGGVVHWLYDPTGTEAPGGDFDPDNPVSGSLTLTPDEVDDLLAGDYYVNVHTEAHGSGEIRGQIEPYSPPAAFNALLQGSNHEPPVETEALGIARFDLTGTDTLSYSIHVTEIVSITMAHIHLGAPDEDGPVVHWLYDPSGTNAPGGPFDADNPVSGTLTLNAENLVDLLTGYYYVNVHTEANPGGEIRGQIGGVNVFAAALNGAQEAPAIDTRASGKATMALGADAETLYYRLMVRDIGNITMSHIHRAAADTNGPVVHWLYDPSGMQAPGGVFDAHNPVAGSLTLSNEDIFDLLRGDFYVNVHTTSHGSGEIRGQLGPQATPDHFNALLSGAQEPPPVNTEAVGVARFTYDANLDMLHYNVTVRDLVSPTMAHIHKAWPGQNGPVVHWLYDAAGSNAPGGDWNVDNPVASALALSAEHTVDLLTGYYYVNAHTPAHPAGEIRGQIDGAQLFEARLSGDNEVPPVDTEAAGRAVMGLSADTSTLYYRMQVSDIMSITMAHIHNAPPGENGSVVHWLYDPSGMNAPGGPFDGGNPVSGSLSLSTADILELVAGDYYVNVHTSDHGSGEIRGQLAPYQAATHFQAALSGDNEVPPVSTSANGMAQFTLYAGMDALHYFISVADITEITMSHIHKGWPDENGPVVHWLYDAAGVNAQDGPWDEDNPIGGCLMLNAEQMVDLVTGYYYVNVHTSEHGAGEIRGQIGDLYRIAMPAIFK